MGGKPGVEILEALYSHQVERRRANHSASVT